MEFNQEITVAAPREKVWDFIWQVEEFAACVPGVKDVEKIDDSTYGVLCRAEGQFPQGEFSASGQHRGSPRARVHPHGGRGEGLENRGEPQAEERGDA